MQVLLRTTREERASDRLLVIIVYPYWSLLSSVLLFHKAMSGIGVNEPHSNEHSGYGDKLDSGKAML